MGSSSSQEIRGASGEIAKSIFDFEVEGIDGKAVPLSTFRGKKAYLLVNTARK